MSQQQKYKIVLVAGEPSGDFLGAQLMKALKKKNPFLEFYGVGGHLMAEEGLHSFFPLSDLAIMGLFESPLQAFKVWRRLKKAMGLITEIQPHVIVTIDFPGFNFRLGKQVKKRLKETALIHYVAPTVWAWRPGRAKKVSKFLDHLLALFPFEPPYFKKYSLPTTFVGHPVVEMGFEEGEPKRFRKKYNINSADTLITVLPGSRRGELNHHLPIFQKTVEQLKEQVPTLTIVIPTLPEIKDYIEKKWTSTVPAIFITQISEKKDAYAASQMAIAASGTIALELAQARLPMIIAYKISWLNALMVKMLVQVRYFCMVNILLRRYVVPELLQKNCTASNLTLETLKLLRNPQKRQQQQDAFHRVDDLLKPSLGLPSENAADIILRYLEKKAH